MDWRFPKPSLSRKIWVMKKQIALYAVIIALAAFALEWLEYRYFMQSISMEIYVIVLAAGFTVLGVWAGHALTRKTAPGPFEKNIAALKSLKVTDREYDVLALLGEGQSNKEIARSLDISPNTVKTHIARLYEKLEVARRAQAVQKAKELSLIP